MKLFTVAALATVVSSHRVAIEPFTGIPSSWTLDPKHPSPDTEVAVTVAVKQDAAGKAILEKEVSRRSDPENLEFYAKWLNKAEVDALVAPSNEAISSVMGWLTSGSVSTLAGQVQRSASGDWITAKMTIRQAEQILDAHYRKYVQGNHAVIALNTTYTLPAEVAQHVDFVSPGDGFPVATPKPIIGGKAALDSNGKPTGPGTRATPVWLRKLYGATNAKGDPTSKTNRHGVADLGLYLQSDLNKYISAFFPGTTAVKVKNVDDKNRGQGGAGIEASLDVQVSSGVGLGVPMGDYGQNLVANYTPSYSWVKLFKTLDKVSDDELPWVISISAGQQYLGSSIESWAARGDVELQKLGARGTSFLTAAGDGGVAGNHGGDCGPQNQFNPVWPASSPWVTTVAATTSSDADPTHEVPVSTTSTNGQWATGGGFSWFADRPSYQNAAVENYFQTAQEKLPSAKLWNKTGRAYPDVAAYGTSFPIEINGKWFNGVGGTSASGPTFNGLVSLVIEARLAAGKKPMGLLNQFIWKTAGPKGAFNDITTGNNGGGPVFGCGTNGFPAAKGWDAASGWGTPKFEKLKELALSLP